MDTQMWYFRHPLYEYSDEFVLILALFYLIAACFAVDNMTKTLKKAGYTPEDVFGKGTRKYFDFAVLGFVAFVVVFVTAAEPKLHSELIFFCLGIAPWDPVIGTYITRIHILDMCVFALTFGLLFFWMALITFRSEKIDPLLRRKISKRCAFWLSPWYLLVLPMVYALYVRIMHSPLYL